MDWWAGIAQSVQRLASGWTVRASNSGGGDIFHTRPDRLCCSLGTGFFPGIKRPGRDVDHPSKSSAEVKERVELYLYSPSGPSCSVLEWNLFFTFILGPLRWGHGAGPVYSVLIFMQLLFYSIISTSQKAHCLLIAAVSLWCVAQQSTWRVTSDFLREAAENALFWLVTQQVVVNSYRRFGTTYQSHPRDLFPILH